MPPREREFAEFVPPEAGPAPEPEESAAEPTQREFTAPAPDELERGRPASRTAGRSPGAPDASGLSRSVRRLPPAAPLRARAGLAGRTVPPARRRLRRPTSSVKTRSWSPGAIPSRRRSSPDARRSGCWSYHSVARPSRRSSCTPPTCASRSSRSKAGRSRRWQASMATRASPWSPTDASSPVWTTSWRGHRAQGAAVRPRPRFARGPAELRLAAPNRRGLRRPRRRVPHSSSGAALGGGCQGLRRSRGASAPRTGRGSGGGSRPICTFAESEFSARTPRHR